jgi:hypothetical protein
MSWVAVGIGAAVGLTKAYAVDAPKEARQRKLAAATQRYSPWTGLKAGSVQEADPFGSTLQGGMAGATYGVQNKALAGKSGGGGSTIVNVAPSTAGSFGNNADMSQNIDMDSFLRARNNQPGRWNLLSSGGQ